VQLLLSKEIHELNRLEKELETLTISQIGTSAIDRNRRYYDTLRKILHLYEDVVVRCSRNGMKPEGKDYAKLRNLAGNAIEQLAGQAEPSPISLKDYDHNVYGPFLGVSDEGSAAPNIREAALTSPKMITIGHAAPIAVGVSHDAERLAAVGEVAVGPEEYRQIRLECIGRILTSTNVGTRLNLRYYKKRAIIKILPNTLEESIAYAKQQTQAVLEPFWHTPDKIPRPITVFVNFVGRPSFGHRFKILETLAEAFNKGDFCDPKVHKLGLLVFVGRGERGVQKAMRAIDLAKSTRLAEVAIKGVVLGAAEDKISMPGLLNYFQPKHASKLLRYAEKKGIPLTPINVVDPDTVARNVWSGLCTAKNMGLELGKYGLFPLTFDESDHVMEKIQSWFSSWTAAPAYYIDLPSVNHTTVYAEENVEEGIRKWLEIVYKHSIPVVLIDTADKGKGRRLLKNSLGDRVGILQLEQIARIDEYANDLGIRVLWAGGITVPQAFEMGRLGVFGVYVTSATAIARPVSGEYEHDIMLAEEKEPTFHGVYRVKLLLEAGFLVNRLKEYGLTNDAEQIADKVNDYLRALKRGRKEEIMKEQNDLVSLTVKAWKQHFKTYSIKH